MKKIFSLALFLITSQLVWGSVCTNELTKSKHFRPQENECNAPPPDSFRITRLGYNFISVAWNSAAIGEKHLLTVFQQGTSNSWDSLYSLTIFNATSYTINNLDSNHVYSFKIRTICTDGVPSNSFSMLFPPHGLIIELTTGGRIPLSPTLVDCENINYLDPENKWIGFKISEFAEGSFVKSTLFEFEKAKDGEQVLGRIKRVEDGNNLVAARTPQGTYPDPTVESGLLFRMQELNHLGSNYIFGYVQLDFSTDPPLSINLCQAPSLFWDNNFIFEPLVASEIKAPTCAGCPNPGGHEHHGRMSKSSESQSITVQNPFSNSLNIYFPTNWFIRDVYNITLLDINGKSYLKKQFDISASQISIPLDSFAPGFYMLRIENNGNFQNFKIVKSE